jgi:streptogramin lyase
MKSFRKLGLMAIAAAALAAAGPAAGGSFTGTITDADGGAGLEGVMIRTTDKVSGMSETIYTRPDGTFTLETKLAGELLVRARTPYYRDVETKIELAADGTARADLVMAAMTDAAEISDSLPAAYHFGSLPFETGDDAVFNQYQFQRDCLSCHQLGNDMTRRPRNPESWHQTIVRMHRYMGGRFDEKLRRRRSVILSEGFDGEPISIRPEFPLDESLSRAKIYEYRLKKGNPHDAIVHLKSGLIYSADQVYSHFTVTDTVTGESKYISQEGRGNQFHAPGGKVKKFTQYTRNSPHSMDLGLDGKYYVTNTATNTIGVFDPERNRWEPSHVIGGGANYPHTIRVDNHGIAWFTIAGSEKLGRLDPESGETTVITLPYATSGGVSGGTQPYGIDINPIDGGIWYGRLFGDRIGHIDPETLKVSEWASPVRGPRRMRFDAAGTLWVSGYSEGELARLQPTADGFDSTVYAMPEFAPGFRPAPYALGVNPITQDIWLNENMTDRMYRFIPSEERFVVYPVPLRGTYTRDFSFTADGKACTSNNPFPLASLEGGKSEILCVEVF